MRRLSLALLLLCGTAARTPSALDAAVQDLAEGRWQAGLDQTTYPPSPYLRPEQLPATIAIETHYQTFNDYYYYALVDGRVWYKPRFKRPQGATDWVTDLEWKPFGLNEGLPYRLDHRKPSAHDNTFADGDRNGFVPDRTFETAAQEDWETWIDRDGWDRASTWEGDPIAFEEDFPQVDRIVAITSDDEEIAVLSDSRQMFYRRKFSNIFVSTEWYAGWGQAKDLAVHFPAHLTGHRGWSLGRITADGVGYKEGPDGRIFEWGPAAVSMETMVWLSPNGRKIFYLDSGTPPEVAHFVEAPFRGQYRGEAIDSSASTILLIDRFGAVLTKIADFDLLGSTPTHPYCYFEECDDEPYYPPGDIRSGMSDIRLPAEGWATHPPIRPPDEWDEDTWISNRVMVLATGKGNVGRELRVVGGLNGEVGFFHKPLKGGAWSFRVAPEGDRAFENLDADILQLDDLRRWDEGVDLQALHAGEPALDQALVGRLALEDGIALDLLVEDFNLEASPWQAHLQWREVDLPIEMHLVQAWSPYMAPHSAHDAPEILTYECTLAFDRRFLEEQMQGGEASSPEGLAVRHLLDDTKNARFALVVNATPEGFEVRPKARRRLGRGFAVALRPDLHPESEDVSAWTAAFWARQTGHMGWTQEVEALEEEALQEADCTLSWAARVLELEERIDAEVKALNATFREARRFSRFTFATSGLLYLTQAKTIDAALDNRRAWRGAEVRPNELRFNVITGVTSRIPHLSANISKVQKQRWSYAKAEAEALEARLDALRKGALKCGEGSR